MRAKAHSSLSLRTRMDNDSLCHSINPNTKDKLMVLQMSFPGGGIMLWERGQSMRKICAAHIFPPAKYAQP
jgi:hypothetical protein